MAFCRIDDRPIRVRCRVSEPDYVIVQDATILGELNVADGLKRDGTMLVNTDKGVEKLGVNGPFRVCCFSADEVARRILGRPIMNTALLGAFAAITGELSLDAVVKAVRGRFPGQLGEKNALVVEESFVHLSRAMT